jgi:hypothetical protein
MLNYQQWNQGHFERFLRSAEHHRHERAYRAADGSAPSLEQWAYHTHMEPREFAQPRRNAIRFGYAVDCFTPIFAPALTEIRAAAPAAAPAAPAGPAAPATGHSLAVAFDDPIDGYGRDAATHCTHRAAPGALALLHELQARFRGHSDGIENCRNVAGGNRLSLHAEGRAVDWHLNAADPADATEAERIIEWLLAPDADGNADALARRMGIQEIIWNRRIWSAFKHAEGFRAYRGPNPHTDHVHIGLTRAGAERRTSYWRAHPTAPAPGSQVPAPAPAPGPPSAPAVAQDGGSQTAAPTAVQPPVGGWPMAPPPGTGVTLTAADERRIAERYPHVVRFYRRYVPLVTADQRATGVPATFTLAQGGIESGWGSHAPGGMLFGVKANEDRVLAADRQLIWTHETVTDAHEFDNYEHEPAEPIHDRHTGTQRTDNHGRPLYRIRVKLWFRRFASEAESIANHSRFLQTNRRYAEAFQHTSDPSEFARIVARAGYATGQALDHGYERELINAIGLVNRVAAYVRAHPQETSQAHEPVIGAAGAAARGLPASALHWDGATPEQLDFMRRVYEVQLHRSERARPFVGDVSPNELALIEGGTKARIETAAACRDLLAAARAGLAAAQSGHDPHAAAVERISLVSGYRSASQQLAAWQANFPTYYHLTQEERRRMPGGEHGEQAVEVTARYVGARLAAPGYSLHNNGLAIDFGTRESGHDLGAHTNAESLRRWKASWLFAWLMAHAGDYGLFQNRTIDEPWHWEFRGRPSATTHEWARPLAAIAAQDLPVDDLALLRDHHEVNPDMILRWNAMPAIPDQLDVVVHLHGFSGAHPPMNLNIKLPISGLDFVPPPVAGGRPQPSWSGRTRSTLCVLPRGKRGAHPRDDGVWPYRFPAITNPSGFQGLLSEAISRFCAAVGASNPIPLGRLILTAHSGGGAPLNAILAFTESHSLDPHEVHVFDALYGATGNIDRWLSRRLGDDARRLAAGVADPIRYVGEQAGALRIFYLGGAGTQDGSRALDAAAARLIPSGTPYSAPLRNRYRAQRTVVPHGVIAYWYGGRLLADAGQAIPSR